MFWVSDPAAAWGWLKLNCHALGVQSVAKQAADAGQDTSRTWGHYEG